MVDGTAKFKMVSKSIQTLVGEPIRSPILSVIIRPLVDV